MLKSLWQGFEYQKHQVEGVEWMMSRENMYPYGGILCDEMGLGKTIQMLGLMKMNKEKATLLVAPLAVLDQWHATAERCGYSVWRANSKDSIWDMPKNYNPSAIQLYLVNYERIMARPLLVTRRAWERVVFDEAHRLGSHKSKTYKLARNIMSCHTWLLTATPIVNNEMNAAALFELMGYEKVPKTLSGMRTMIETSVLCRKMDDLRDVIKSLPKAAKETTHILDFASPEEEDIYRGVQGVIQRQWRALEQESNSQASKFRLIMRLRQLSTHPQVYHNARKRQWAGYNRADFTGPSTKFMKLRELIEEEAAAGKSHRWIVFCHFNDEMNMIEEYLKTSSVVHGCYQYSGRTTYQEKLEVIKKSKCELSGNQQMVLLVQLKSGGTGLNLQHCDRIVFMGPWWTAALMDQAIGRAVRIGQENDVLVHKLVLREETTMNIDKHMMEKAESKRAMCEKFLSIAKDMGESNEGIVEDDMESLEEFEME